MRKCKPSHLRASWDPISLLSGSPPWVSHPTPLQTYRKTLSLGVSWTECGENSMLCPLALGSANREGMWGEETNNSTCRGCGTGWDAWEMRCLLPTLLWGLLGWHPGVGAQPEAWYSARPSPSNGHRSCQAEKETNRD